MEKADLFAYLAAFVTIVLAVALTDMIQSAHRLLRDRARVKFDLLTPLLALNVLLGLLSEFFGLWADARFEQLTFYGLVALMIVPTLAALATFAVLPDEVPERGLDLRSFYFANSRYVAALLILASAVDYIRFIRRVALNGALGDPDVWWWFVPMAGLNLLLLALIFWSRNWWVQLAALLGLLALGHLSFGRWSIAPLPAA